MSVIKLFSNIGQAMYSSEKPVQLIFEVFWSRYILYLVFKAGCFLTVLTLKLSLLWLNRMYYFVVTVLLGL